MLKTRFYSTVRRETFFRVGTYNVRTYIHKKKRRLDYIFPGMSLAQYSSLYSVFFFFYRVTPYPSFQYFGSAGVVDQ